MIARSFLLFVGIAIGGVAVHYYDKAEWQKAQDILALEHQAAIKQAQEQSGIEAKALQLKVDELEVKAVLDQSMIDRYTQEIAKLQNELSTAKSELEFYEQALPSGPAGSMSIRSFDVTREGPMLSYKLLLSRHAAGESTFNGRMQFIAKGKLKDKVETIELVPAVVNADNELTVPDNKAETKDLLKDKRTSSILLLQFVRWQQAKGNLVLPSGFEPMEITVNILEGRHVRASKTVMFEAP
ncbi:MAG: DUF6776 family protein [Pelistega sp.]|nr:DUF6776 family protein [Pelistega sp.]